MPTITDVDNITSFADWYRKNAKAVDIRRICSILNVTAINDKRLENIYTVLFKTSGFRQILHESLYDNYFVSLDIQHDMESCDMTYTKYIIDKKHKVHMFTKKSSDKKSPCIKKISTIINFMQILAKTQMDNVPNIDLVVICSDQKKLISKNTKMLCCDNINSGSTYVGLKIVCWRQEEIYKVLIHELFHFFGFDFFTHDSHYKKLDTMLALPKVVGSDSINESYTETMTILILCIYNSITELISSGKSLTNDDIIHMAFDKMKYEITFILFQMSKIIHIFGGTSFDDYMKEKIVLSQTTSVRSYFIIKLLLLMNIGGLLELIDNPKYNHIIIQDERLIDFGRLINLSLEKFMSNRDSIDMCSRFIKLIGENKQEKWIYKTCRMCVDLYYV
jgi:hypothetical protein